MRNLAILMLLLLLLAGCFGPRYYTSKGASYLEQPLKELDNCYKMPNQPVQGAEQSTIPIPGHPLGMHGKIFFPVETTYIKDGMRHSYTTIYAMYADSSSVADSLVLQEENVRQSYRKLVYHNSLYAVGTRDSLCHIYQLNDSLKIMNEYTTPINIANISYVGVYDGRLRLAGQEPDKRIVMYELTFEDMQVQRKRLLLEDFNRYDADGDTLWYFSAADGMFDTAIIDMSQYDPNPSYKNFAVDIPEANGNSVYKVKTAGGNIYLSYSWFTEEGVPMSRLIKVDYAKGDITTSDLNGYLSYDVAAVNGKTYLYRTAPVKNKQVFTVAELGADLLETNQVVSFFLADMENALDIQPYTDSKYFLTGVYYQKTGNKIYQTMPDGKKTKVDETYPQPFLAILTLE